MNGEGEFARDARRKENSLNELTMKQLRYKAEGFHEHARGCKRPIDACAVCKVGIQWFGALPPMTLAQVLEEAR